MLEMLDLSPSESACYEALVAHPRSTADELGRRIALDSAPLQQALQGLEDKGLVTASHDEPPQLVPAPPEVAVEVVILRQRERFERARIYAAELMDRYRGTEGQGEVADYVELVRGREAIQQRSEQIQRLARTELQLLVPCRQAACMLGAGGESDPIAEPVEVRRICERQALEGDGGGSFPPTRSQNEDVRVVPTLPLTLAVADRALGLLPCDDEDEPAAFVVTPCRLLDVMIHLADTLWELAAPVAPAGSLARSDGVDVGLTGRDLEILQFLQAGLTDFAISRRLDVSERTVGRRVSALMRAAGAQTRFQLGWRAAERGWLTAVAEQEPHRPQGETPTIVTTLPELRARSRRSEASIG
jgi:DNA-binding CsgD family transcriptional regulator